MRGGSRAARGLATALMVCLLAMMAMGVSDTAARFDDLGHKMMCTCGCGQVLLQCNHHDCPGLARESGELQTALDRGDSDNTILMAFQNEYGPTVLAAPMFTRFNMIAWIVPPLLLVVGIGGTVLLVRRWRLRAAAQPPVMPDTETEELRKKIRKDTEE